MNATKPVTDPDLTPREREILKYVAQGHGTKQIADQLKISENTVANHRKSMLAKTGAKSSAELIYLYINFYQKNNSHL